MAVALGSTQWVVRSEEEYASLMRRYAVNGPGGRLAEARSKMRETLRRGGGSLFDILAWTRDFERALMMLWESHNDPLKPKYRGNRHVCVSGTSARSTRNTR